VKIGHAQQGIGKIKVENAQDFQDIVSIVSISNLYATIEPFIEAKCDIHVQKIGETYKAYMRKSINSNWKTNHGSAMLEQIPVSEKYKFWIDEASKLFGGLDLCALQIIVESETGKEYIIDMVDCGFSLLGESSQEGDRRLIADLVMDKMHEAFLNSNNNSDSAKTKTRSDSPPKTNPNLIMSRSTSSNDAQNNMTSSFMSNKKTSVQSMDQILTSSHNKESLSASTSGHLSHPKNAPVPPPRPTSPYAATSSHSKPKLNQIPTNLQKANSNHSSNVNLSKSQINDDSEDTMNNLRKTFAGIFGNSDL
jgi:hypothetical protein